MLGSQRTHSSWPHVAAGKDTARSQISGKKLHFFSQTWKADCCATIPLAKEQALQIGFSLLVGKALMMLLSTVWPGLLATEARGNFAMISMIFVMQPALFQSLSEMPRCLKVICGDPLVKIEAEQLKPK